MDRRQYLIVSCGVALTGCSSLDSTAGSLADATPTPTPPTTPTEQASTPTETKRLSPAERHYKTLEIGSRDNVENPKYIDPHEVVIVNDGDSPREVTITISTQRNDTKRTEAVLDTSYEIPTAQEPRDEPPWENSIYIEIIEPAAYTIDLQLPAEDSGMQISISEDNWDCNRVTHTMSVQADGQIELTEMAETVGCSTPSG